jgi:hypothetical protein
MNGMEKILIEKDGKDEKKRKSEEFGIPYLTSE